MSPQKVIKKAGVMGYFGVLVIPFVTFLLGLTVGYNQAKHDIVSYEKNGNNNMSNVSLFSYPESLQNVNLSLFWDVWKKVSDIYVDASKIDTQTMVYGAIRGMVESLEDPYTIFMDPKESSDFRNSLSGDLEGIGAELSSKENHLVIVSPLKNSPAEKAGILPGDIIYKIDDALAHKMSLTEAVSKIRGKKGTSVHLTIVRQDIATPIELDIIRDEIHVPSVSWELKDNNIAYISINQFGDDTSKEFKNTVNQLLLKKPKGIVLDLRFNGGGYLDGAVDIVSEFVSQGIATTIQRRIGSDEIQQVDGKARLSAYPLVVLINEGSASASEIVAGAIQDHQKGTIMGEKSFGKGTVQELQPLTDGSSLRITIAKWYTPNHRSIDGEGITPDIAIVDNTETKDIDEQLDQALQYLYEKIK